MAENDPELMVIELDKIHASDAAMRTVDRTCESYMGLVDSIKKAGVLTSILVRRKFDSITGEELFELIDGAQRTQASRDAGLKTIGAKIITATQGEAMEAQLMANVHRVDTPACQYSAHLRRMMFMNPTLTLLVLADKVAKSPTWVSNRLSLSRIKDKDIQELINQGKINITNAYTLAKLPPEHQRELVDQAMTLPPSEFLPVATARAKEIRASNQAGSNANPIVFQPQPFTQKLKALKEELDTNQQATFLCGKYKPASMEQAFSLAIAWTLHMDPFSKELQQAQHEERVQLREEKKAKRIAERQKRAEEQQKKLAEEAAQVQARLDAKAVVTAS